MSEIDIQVEGLKDLEKSLLKLGAKLGGKTLRSAVSDTLKPIQKTAKELVAQDSGLLKRSIRRRARISRTGRGGRTAVVGAVSAGSGGKSKNRKGEKVRRAFYAHMIEFGTKRSVAKPFMRPAYDQHKTSIPKNFAKILRLRVNQLPNK